MSYQQETELPETQSLLSFEYDLENSSMTDLQIQQSKQKLLNRWSLLGVGATVIALVIFAINISQPSQYTVASNEYAAIIKKAGGTVGKAVVNRAKKAVKTAYAKLSRNDHKVLFHQFKKMHNKKVSFLFQLNHFK
jgi:hypothetical protein